MTKYSIITFRNDLMEFIDKMQDLGVMDITRSNRAFDETSKAKIEKIKGEKETIKKLKSFIKNHSDVEGHKIVIPHLEHLNGVVNRLFADLNTRTSKLDILLKEKEIAAPWGEFHPEDIEKLHSMGYRIYFYSVPQKKYERDWENDYAIQVLNTTGENVYFVIIAPQGETNTFPLNESPFPEQPESEILKGIEILEAQIASLHRQLVGMGNYLPEMEMQCEKESEDLERYFAYSSSTAEAENTLAVLEGFAPTENDKEVQEFLDSSDALYITEAAKAEDNPPIKLKNNWFAKLFEPIGNLYVLPTYNELDLTPYFAPFYMLFFGLCLGDMGYGLIILLASLFIIWKVPSLKDYGKLGIFLGVGTIIMPMLNGTFFGTKIYNIIDMPDNIVQLFFSDIKMFWFAIVFGLVHIIIARIISAIFLIRRYGWQHGLSNFGWCFILAWVALLYAGSEMGRSLIPDWLGYVLGIGGLALVLFFTKPVGNIAKRLFGGIAALYDITGFFGDVLSYIRLFGLGAAGGCLGMVINSMSLALSGIPYAGWVLCIILLVFGHLFVMLLSALGAFVHPMRLTFVEFYKNAGFNGGGKEYRPLRKKSKN